MTCRLWIGFACSSAPGVRPGSRPTFFASPKKVIKERRPDGSAPGYRGSLRYSQTGGQPDNSPLSTGTQTGPAVAVYRSYPGLLRCSAQPTGAEQQPHSSLRIAHTGLPLCGKPRRAMRSEPSCIPRGRRRGAQRPEGCRPQGGRTKLFEHRPQGGRVLRSPSGREHRSEPGTSGGAVGSPFFAYFLWRSKESRSAAGPKPRRAAAARTTQQEAIP